MNRFVRPYSITGLPYERIDYVLIPLASDTGNFVQEAAVYFVESWMSSALPQMRDIRRNWDSVPEADKLDYRSYLDHLFHNGELIDAPDNGYTSPIATFAETMLRWLRQSFDPTQLHVEPIVPQPSSEGKIDFVEITGFSGDYFSMKVTLWEVKGSDKQVSSHNSKIYSQLDDYPRRFYRIANHISESYAGDDLAMKLFLSRMSRMVRNRHSQVHYGVFITHDKNVPQKISIVPNLHQHPPGHPSSQGTNCHHLAVLLIPDFKNLRLEVWRSLHLV